jgi:SPP1 family phage portal protein
MYITELDLLKQKLSIEGKLNISEIIKNILNDAAIEERRIYMNVGERYYENGHDILYHDFRCSTIYDTVEDPDNFGQTKDVINTVTNNNNSNMHNVHNFHQLQVDQKVSYIAGKAPTISVENDKEFESLLTKRTTDEEFPDLIYDWIEGASNKGIEWIHVYYDFNGILQYCIVPAQEVIAFYDSEHQKELQDIVRFYMFDVISNGKTVKRHKIEWWEVDKVTYYIEDEQGNYMLDPLYPINPMPHWWDITTVDNMEQSKVPQTWGRVPFIPLHNNSHDISDLLRNKSLIDAYNMISSTSTNNQIDLVELYWVIHGYGGETAKAIAKKLQINKSVSINSEEGSVTAQQITLNVEERVKWLELLRHDIYHFGMAIDTSDEQLGNNPSGVSLKFKYTQLDLKANPLILKLKKALKDLFWFITVDINLKNNASYDSKKIVVAINKSMITNDLETVNMINASKGLVPDNLLLAAHPLVEDANQAAIDLKAQQDDLDKRRAKLFGNNDIPPGGED